MFYLDHRLTIIIGAYGSGKSEIAVNMSLAQRKALPDRKLLIADLDIVNPFYRSSDCASVLEEAGIRLVTPMYAGSNVDAPVLPPDQSDVGPFAAALAVAKMLRCSLHLSKEAACLEAALSNVIVGGWETKEDGGALSGMDVVELIGEQIAMASELMNKSGIA